MDEVEERIRAEFPGCEIIIHADPLGIREAKDHFELRTVTTDDASSGRPPDSAQSKPSAVHGMQQSESLK
jgi:hypothetical protein